MYLLRLFLLQGLQIAAFDKVSKNAFFRKIDENNSGFITFNEFCFMMCHLLDKKNTGSIVKKIRKFDYLNVLADSGPVKMPLAPSIYKEKLQKKKEKKEILKRIAKKKKQDEKESSAQMNKTRGKRLKKNRKIHYSVSNDDESKGNDDNDDGEAGDIDTISPFVGSNYDDEELDELRALAPPEVSNCISFLQLFPFCAMYVDNALAAMNMGRKKGPHGVFCLCGCRANGDNMY